MCTLFYLPNSSSRTLTKGARQLVVHEALLLPTMQKHTKEKQLVGVMYEKKTCRSTKFICLAWQLVVQIKQCLPHNVGGLVRIFSLIYSDNVGGDISTFGRGSDDNFLRSSLDVLSSSRAINKNSGTLYHVLYFNSVFSPWILLYINHIHTTQKKSPLNTSTRLI